MRHLGYVCVVGLALVAAAGAQGAPLAWVTGYRAAMAQAQERHQLVALVLTSEMCDWCTKLKAETLISDRVTALAGDFVFVEVDVSADRDLGNRYARRGVPQIVFLDGSGQTVGQFTGYVPDAVFAAEMRRALGNRQIAPEIARLEKQVADNPDDVAAAARLGRLYVQTRQDAQAVPVLARAAAHLDQLDTATRASVELDTMIASLAKRDGELAPDFRDWLTANPDHPLGLEATYYAGYAHAMRGDGQGALDLWATVIRAQPESVFGLLAAHYRDVVRQRMESRGQ